MAPPPTATGSPAVSGMKQHIHVQTGGSLTENGMHALMGHSCDATMQLAGLQRLVIGVQVDGRRVPRCLKHRLAAKRRAAQEGIGERWKVRRGSLRVCGSGYIGHMYDVMPCDRHISCRCQFICAMIQSAWPCRHLAHGELPPVVSSPPPGCVRRR